MTVEQRHIPSQAMLQGRIKELSSAATRRASKIFEKSKERAVANRGTLVLVLLSLIGVWLTVAQYQMLRLQQASLREDTYIELVPTADCSQTATVEKEDYAGALENALSVCSALDHGASLASSLWRKHLSLIEEASHHPADTEHFHDAWIHQLLQVLKPNFMNRGIFSSLLEEDMKYIVDIIDERMRNESAPAFQVIVFGGSVPEGAQCDILSPNMPNGGSQRPKIQGRDCAWPFRLQLLADGLLGHGIIKVHNIAVGGTNSDLALPTLRYGLYPDELRDAGGPDLIINGYGVNDNLPTWEWRENSTATREHAEFTLGRAQRFIETAYESKPCKRRPALIFYNEYFGNQNSDIILGEDIRNDMLRQLASQYNFMFVSSQHMLQHFVFADEKEEAFSPYWFMRGKRVTDGHFHMPGHVYAAYALAYAGLKSTIDYCAKAAVSDGKPRRNSLVAIDELSSLAQAASPPWLDQSLTLEAYPSLWRKTIEERVETERAYCREVNHEEKPCPFAFVATPAGTARDATQLNKYLRQFFAERGDNWRWQGENNIRNGWQNKLGLVAHEVGAFSKMTIRNITNPVRLFTVQYLKSYGEEWDGSRARFNLTVYDGDTIEYDTSFVFEGFHNSSTSIGYQEEIDLGDNAAKIGRTIVLTIQLIAGPQFKIISLMLCSR